MYSKLVNRLSATRPGSWAIVHLASKVDPTLFRLTNGRFTITGKPTLPQLTMTTVGRKSGAPRAVQLAYHRDGDDYLIVASAMGAERDPAWRYNLEANPDVDVQVRGRTFKAHATILTDDEKAPLWPAIAGTIPQMHTYVERTDRNLRVFRLTETPG